MSGNQYNTYCIYRLVCVPTSKCYIGQTCNYKKRTYEHFRLLKTNQHYNQHLQNAYNQYGLDHFQAEVVESGIASDNIDAREKHWITYYDSLNNGFNKAPGGDLSYRGKPCTWNGTQYDSVTMASAAIGIDRATLCEHLNSGYSCDDDIYAAGEQCNKPCVWNGIDYPSQKLASVALGISTGAMKFRIQSGYKCDEDMPQRVSCIWNGIQYKSISECARLNGIPPVTLSRWIKSGIVCDNDRPTYRKVL